MVRSTPRFLVAPVPALVALGLLACLLVGCSGDTDDGESGPAASSAAATGRDAADTVTVKARTGTVAGRLSRARQRTVTARVGAVVQDWWDAAYVATGKDVTGKEAFADFTGGAARQARRQVRVLTNAHVDTGVRFGRNKVLVDVLAVGGKAVGATARFAVVMRAEGAERPERVAGRLVLTPVGKDWKVFGFEVDRESRAPAARGRRGGGA